MALAVSVGPSTALAQEKLVHHELDRNTNSIVRVWKTSNGGRIEVETPDLLITKSVAGSRVVTSMRGVNGDRLMIEFNEKMLAVETTARKIKTTTTDRERVESARMLIANSAIGQKAAALIGRLGLRGHQRRDAER
jgi:hypothetical protein